MLCGLAGALELAIDARLPRDAVISIDRLIDRSATAPLGLTPNVCWIQSCVPVTDIAGHKMSSFSCRFLVEAEEQMVRRETTQFPIPRVWLEFAIKVLSPYIKDECLILDYVGFVSE